MQAIHLTFPLDQLHGLVAALEAQFEAQQPEVTVLDFGASYKQSVGYLVLQWADEVDASFIHHLTADPTILDFCVYSIPWNIDDPFGPLMSTQEGGTYR